MNVLAFERMEVQYMLKKSDCARQAIGKMLEECRIGNDAMMNETNLEALDRHFICTGWLFGRR